MTPPVPYYGNVRKSRTILQLMSSLIVWREGRQRSLGAPALVALARRNARGGSDFLELLLDGGKVSKTLPAADGGALLVERVRPHHKGFGDGPSRGIGNLVENLLFQINNTCFGCHSFMFHGFLTLTSLICNKWKCSIENHFLVPSGSAPKPF